MTEMNHSILEKKQIIKPTIISMIIGFVLLITAVLPAEYGIDPTGVGKAFGFPRLYIPEDGTSGTDGSGTMVTTNFPLIKMEKAGSGSNVPRPSEADNPAPETQLTHREDSVEVIVPVGKGIEYKINMLKHGKMKYEWTTNDKSMLYFDFHGEVKQAKAAKAVYLKVTQSLTLIIWWVLFYRLMKVSMAGFLEITEARMLQ